MIDHHRSRLRILPVVGMVCVLLMPASAQQNPLEWFPLQMGSHWVYEHESKSGDRNRPDIDRWITEETVTGRVTIPEGLAVLRDVKQRPNSNERITSVPVIAPNGQLRYVQQPDHNRGILTARESEPYLVRGNCVYVIGGGWDVQKQELRPEFRTYLSEGDVSPDFCFPLQIGGAWGNNDIPWRVGPAREGVSAFLPAEYAGAIHIFSSHFGSGGWKDVWFQKGVGVVAGHYIHNGTYDESSSRLLSFSP